MAAKVLTITSDQTKEKETRIVGTALMNPGDARLDIQIPTDHVAPSGRRVKVAGEILLIVEPI